MRYRPREYDSEDGPWDPISGGASALLGTIGSLMMGFADFPVEILRALRVKPSENRDGPEGSYYSSILIYFPGPVRLLIGYSSCCSPLI